MSSVILQHFQRQRSAVMFYSRKARQRSAVIKVIIIFVNKGSWQWKFLSSPPSYQLAEMSSYSPAFSKGGDLLFTAA